MIPFSEFLFFQPPSTNEMLKVSTIISVQLFIIERAFVTNIASAVFSDLHSKQQELADAAESRNRLMARMSHEIRTPLSGVLGLIEAWAIQERSEQRAQDLKRILGAAGQLKRVIDDVLDFSKLSAGKMRVEPMVCNLSALFSDIVNLYKTEADRKGIQIDWEIEESLTQDIVIDSYRLQQILNNLISNAIKFTPQGSIHISAWDVDAHIDHQRNLVIAVQDTGIGISHLGLGNLFRPFEQVGPESTRKVGGTGLGLAICRELAELLGGKIEVSSKLGKGTTFKVTLPLIKSTHIRVNQDSHPPVPHASEEIHHGKKKLILVVEDDPVNQLVASRFIEAEGFAVQVVDNGPDALEILKQQSGDFSLVLMDYYMPTMDGCEVTRKFRAFEKKNAVKKPLPIVGLTASILQTDHQNCLAAGMNDVLMKPIGRNALRQVIKQVLSRKS